MFKPVPSQVDFVAQEHEVLRLWEDTDAFEKLVARSRGARRWSFVDGPITANHATGVHHAWSRTYKDVLQRFKAMRGLAPLYQDGFDVQGAWVKAEVERELGLKTRRDVEAYGLSAFAERCTEHGLRFGQRVARQSKRLGCWTEADRAYYTLSDESNYAAWAFLKQCWERDLLVKGQDVMPWCPRCSTALAEHEVVTDGYAGAIEASVTVRLPLEENVGEYLLVWTKSPWTLTANVAVAVNPDATYLKVRQGDAVYYVAAEREEALRGPYQMLDEMPGTALEGWTYLGPFDELPAQRDMVHEVLLWEAVSAAEGTGIAPIAPGANPDAFRLAGRYGLPVLAPLDELGQFVDGYGWLTGVATGDVTEEILQGLQLKSRMYRVEDHEQPPAACWRCGTPVVFRLVDEWFVKTEPLRYDLMDLAEEIRWIPESALEREMDRLRNLRDWLISTKRDWGLALPIYECRNCGRFEVVGSREELKERAVEGWEEFEGHSPHRPWVDVVKIRCTNCGDTLSRIPDVGSAWLDVGIVPYSTPEYRQNRAAWEAVYPADLTTESAPGQSRNWLDAALLTSAVLEEQAPFKTVMSFAHLRSDAGRETKERVESASGFEEMVEQAGADVLRWVFATHPVDQTVWSGYAAGEARRRFFLPLWNVYSFFVTYANVDRWQPSNLRSPARSPLDAWIIGKLQVLIETVTGRLEEFDARGAALAIEGFTGELSNWYVRRSRRRFGHSENSTDKQAAYATLYEVLATLAKLLAPFTPFLAETMYQNLVRTVDPAVPESVHHCEWPPADPARVDRQALADMDLVAKLAELARAARGQANLKLRQPLARLTVAVSDVGDRRGVERLAELLADEVNVKEIAFAEGEDELVSYAVRPVLPKLGPKYGAQLPKIRQALIGADASRVARAVHAGRRVPLDVEGKIVELEPDEVEVVATARPGYAVSEADGLVVGISTELTRDLVHEGLAREVVRRIQTLRKQAGLDLADPIDTAYQAEGELAEAIGRFREYIAGETLSENLEASETTHGAVGHGFDVDGRPLVLAIRSHN